MLIPTRTDYNKLLKDKVPQFFNTNYFCSHEYNDHILFYNEDFKFTVKDSFIHSIDNKPAIVDLISSSEYRFLNGVLHSFLDLPSMKFNCIDSQDTLTTWHKNGLLHRDNFKHAFIRSESNLITKTYRYYWINGKNYNYYEIEKMIKTKENFDHF
jgi:hypothetical protein